MVDQTLEGMPGGMSRPGARWQPLPSPAALRRTYPATARGAEVVRRGRRAVRDILRGRDGRLLAVVGPCSVHDAGAFREYARRLRDLAGEVSGQLLVIVRAYFEKPRTSVGWKGLISDPHLDGSDDVAAGLALARRLLVEVNELGLACATEFLDPAVAPYLADLIGWGCIGARTAESQPHRQLASGLALPIGFKNGTDGRLETAVNGVLSARRPHVIVGPDRRGRPAVRRTPGNPAAHVVLRGGCAGPNFGREHVERAWRLLGAPAGHRPVLVDCAHDNSGKDPARQGEVCREVVEGFVTGGGPLTGLMLESNLLPGRQPPAPRHALAWGVSITDACIGWDETRQLLRETARRLAAG